jgi:6-phosphogluconolactonase
MRQTGILLFALGCLPLGACGGGGGAPTFSVGGSVSGLTGSGLQLQLNGGTGLVVTANGSFSFADAFDSGSKYAVTIKSQPSSSRCVLTNASGTIAAANIGNVQVQCVAAYGFVYTVDEPDYQILTYLLDLTSGTLLPFGTPVAFASGSFPPMDLIASPDGLMLYASDWNYGTIDSFSVDASSGLLTTSGTTVSSATPNPQPSQMILSPLGNFLYLVNVNANEVDLFDVDNSTGALTFQGAEVSFANRAFANFAQTPDGRFLYVLSYQVSGAPNPTLTVYAVDANSGALAAGLTLAVSNGLANSTALAMDPKGRFLFVAVAYVDEYSTNADVTPYAIDPITGSLTPGSPGPTVSSNAVGLAIDPSGHYAYLIDNYDHSTFVDHIDAFSIDQTSGDLSSLGSPTAVQGAPNSIVADASGKYVMVASVAGPPSGSGYDLSVFSIGSDGTLTQASVGAVLAPRNLGAGLLAVVE